jgi:hypothetical protein
MVVEAGGTGRRRGEAGRLGQATEKGGCGQVGPGHRKGGMRAGWARPQKPGVQGTPVRSGRVQRVRRSSRADAVRVARRRGTRVRQPPPPGSSPNRDLPRPPGPGTGRGCQNPHCIPAPRSPAEYGMDVRPYSASGPMRQRRKRNWACMRASNPLTTTWEGYGAELAIAAVLSHTPREEG